MVTWASVLPDLDGLGIAVDFLTRHSAHPTDLWGTVHHTFGHNLFFGTLLSCCIAWKARQRTKVFVLAMLSFGLHLLGDLVGARGPDGDQWPISLLFPSHTWSMSWNGQWPLNGWQNILITFVLIIGSAELARRRGYSPLEIFSQKGDALFVQTLRNRFGVPAETNLS